MGEEQFIQMHPFRLKDPFLVIMWQTLLPQEDMGELLMLKVEAHFTTAHSCTIQVKREVIAHFTTALF